MHLFWVVVIGSVAGLVVKAITPGTGPSGSLLLAALGIGGSLSATFIGQLLGWYRPGDSAAFFGAMVGAIILVDAHHFATKSWRRLALFRRDDRRRARAARQPQ